MTAVRHVRTRPAISARPPYRLMEVDAAVAVLLIPRPVALHPPHEKVLAAEVGGAIGPVQNVVKFAYSSPAVAALPESKVCFDVALLVDKILLLGEFQLHFGAARGQLIIQLEHVPIRLEVEGRVLQRRIPVCLR
eukprot:CAMPEP_0206222144 /NCGR_PEP_ID=MMETSP0047_2-20121206/5800_1 /ASSEMBLY_ACC=CAM_ASM_000192 /TAXON_ID=195065 /ORGANISM="Chroomonas mesostigmatica_cf, Strain CCMP1168" /LENGTH=134 /DNA_ID=CAMNT_0053644943 /DNA_START=168 /DNA_END=569 /DNA_ORIENTATION=+